MRLTSSLVSLEDDASVLLPSSTREVVSTTRLTGSSSSLCVALPVGTYSVLSTVPRLPRMPAKITLSRSPKKSGSPIRVPNTTKPPIRGNPKSSIDSSMSIHITVPNPDLRLLIFNP